MGFMDIVVYQEDKKTAYIIYEVKRPSFEDGLNQLKDYMGNKWCELGCWSNGSETVVLYRPYPEGFQTLERIPKIHEKIEDLFKIKKTLSDLKKDYNFKNIILVLQELVLANAGISVFRVVFRLLYTKLYDEKQARLRKDNEVNFLASHDPQVTFDRINKLFKDSMEEWPGIFAPNETIGLTPDHLQICISQMENLRFLDSNLRIMDEAFEFLMPEVSKTGMGQYFTPRYVIDMCVKMLNPKNGEYIVDPACGSGGFLIQTMNWVWQHDLTRARV
jgi:type I restriction enzyme M protein